MLPIALFPVRGPTCEAWVASESDQHLAHIIQTTGTYYERKLLDAIRNFHREGVYVDAGANIGNHSVYFVLECPSTRVIAIEPHPRNFEELETTIRVNSLQGKILPLRVALHPTLKEVALVEPDPAACARPNRGMVSVRPGVGVPAKTLSEVLAGYPPVAVLKVDVEGLGVEVIESGLDCIRRDLPLISCEADEGEGERLDALLAPLGYRRNPKNLGRTPTFLWVPRV